jgi:serine/threonine protein kinase
MTKKNRTVTDNKGQCYELTGKVGEGGQGIVCTTNYPNVLVKVFRNGSEEKRNAWWRRIQRLMRQPLEGLPIAHPLALLKSHTGYVMELMDGLVSLSEVMQKADDSMRSEDGLSGYIETGGLLRRLKLLSRLAQILSELHGRGMAYGDISPANIFISASIENAEVWLIDADNIETQCGDSGQALFTPDYGAPEILRGDAGISTLTDCWSFAVLAFRLLVLEHPMKGDKVQDGEPELAEAALRGEFPWVDHSSDHSNSLTRGIPREIVIPSTLRTLFDMTFSLGLSDPSQRPGLSEWHKAIETAIGICLECDECKSSFIYNSNMTCTFCDHPIVPGRVLVMQEYLYTPPSVLREGLDAHVPDDIMQEHVFSKTNMSKVLSKSPFVIRKIPHDSIYYESSEALCTLSLNDEGISVVPQGSAEVFLQWSGQKATAIKRTQTIKSSNRKGKLTGWLHLGNSDETHYAWYFSW